MPQHHTVSINGLQLHYLDWGGSPSPARGVLLFLHGSTCHARVWDSVAAGLSRRTRAIALDLRGHGESEWAAPPAYTAADYVADLREFVEKLDLQNVTIVAHSMAVYHAIRFAVERPGAVAKLVLVDIEAKCRDEHRLFLNAAGLRPAPVFKSLEEVISRERRIAPYASEVELRRFVEHNVRESSSEGGLTYRYDRATLAQFDDYDERRNLGLVKCPALVVRGMESQGSRREMMREMARAIPSGKLVEIEFAGHLPHLDNPEEFERAVTEFCFGAS